MLSQLYSWKSYRYRYKSTGMLHIVMGWELWSQPRRLYSTPLQMDCCFKNLIGRGSPSNSISCVETLIPGDHFYTFLLSEAWTFRTFAHLDHMILTQLIHRITIETENLFIKRGGQNQKYCAKELICAQGMKQNIDNCHHVFFTQIIHHHVIILLLLCQIHGR